MALVLREALAVLAAVLMDSLISQGFLSVRAVVLADIITPRAAAYGVALEPTGVASSMSLQIRFSSRGLCL